MLGNVLVAAELLQNRLLPVVEKAKVSDEEKSESLADSQSCARKNKINLLKTKVQAVQKFIHKKSSHLSQGYFSVLKNLESHACVVSRTFIDFDQGFITLQVLFWQEKNDRRFVNKN